MFGKAKGPVAALAEAAAVPPEMEAMAGQAEAKSEYKLEDIKGVLAQAKSIDEAAQLILDFLNGNESAEVEAEVEAPAVPMA